MIAGLAHVALYTPCLVKTVHFYQDVFQAKTVKEFTLPHKGCWLALGGDILEVFESEALGDGCFKHIALSHGATAHVPPKDITSPCPARIAFVKGPGGEQIELFSPR